MTTSYWIGTELAVFAIALILTGVIIPQILLIAFSRKLFDETDERKIHTGVVPRLGGIAFLPAVIFSICLVLAVNISIGGSVAGDMIEEIGKSALYLLCAEMLIFLIGIADDLIGVRYKAKFAVQIICAVLLCASGAYISDMGGLLGVGSVAAWVGWLLSGFIVVYLVNAINLIDGIDGLASGLSGIALVYYGILATISGQWVLSLLVWGQLGTLVPFFYYNVYGNSRKQKKIFMGDTGSLTLGLILSFVALSVTHLDTAAIPADYNRIVLAFSPLVIPAFDVARVYFHRIRRHRNPFLPDKCHIHHKLLALGFSQRTSLCIILLAATLIMLGNVTLSTTVSATWILAGDIALWSCANILLTRAIRKKEQRLNTSLYD